MAPKMEVEEYLKNRVTDQIDWYDRKSTLNQKKFKAMRISEIILATLIPFISGMAASYAGLEKIGVLVTGALGVIIACLAGLLSLGQFQEHWIEYRTTCESLKKEKFLFETGVEPYNGKDAFSLIVQRTETLISKENTNWAQYMMKSEKGEEKKE